MAVVDPKELLDIALAKGRDGKEEGEKLVQDLPTVQDLRLMHFRGLIEWNGIICKDPFREF